jgi:hypothetical protein
METSTNVRIFNSEHLKKIPNEVESMAGKATLKIT